MLQRHLTTTSWNLMAIEALMERGALEDWREFAAALRADPEVGRAVARVCAYRPADGARELARTLLQHYYPDLGSGEDAFLRPAREAFAASGMSGEELAERLEQEKHAAREAQWGKPFRE